MPNTKNKPLRWYSLRAIAAHLTDLRDTTDSLCRRATATVDSYRKLSSSLRQTNGRLANLTDRVFELEHSKLGPRWSKTADSLSLDLARLKEAHDSRLAQELREMKCPEHSVKLVDTGQRDIGSVAIPTFKFRCQTCKYTVEKLPTQLMPAEREALVALGLLGEE